MMQSLHTVCLALLVLFLREILHNFLHNLFEKQDLVCVPFLNKKILTKITEDKMDLSAVTEGQRLYVQDKSDYANVVRTSFLGLQKAPVVLMDDGVTMRGYAGVEAEEQIIDPKIKQNSYGEAVEIPVDVRYVGIAQLTAHGVSAETQGAMFNNWRNKLTQEQRSTFLASWGAVDTGNASQLSTFLDGMVTYLMSL